MAELIASGDTLDIGRRAINNWYSGTTNIWSAGTGTNSLRTIAGNSTASGRFGFSAGFSNSNSGPYATIVNGSGNTSSGTLSFVGGGINNRAQNAYCVVLNGNNNNASGSKSFIINGNGNTSSGTYSLIGNGFTNTASGIRATVLTGVRNQARNRESLIVAGALNTTTSLSNYFCTILNGYSCQSNGSYSVVLNGITNVASGSFSLVLDGISNTSSGNYSLTFGTNNTAAFSHSVAIGKGATAGAAYQTVFAAGAGNTIRLRYSDGTGSFEGGTNTGPADYAEYFEWADKNPSGDKRFGYAVSLVENGKVQIGGKNIIGIVSSVPAIVGDSSELSWKEKYVTDEWGVKVYETYETFFSKELKKVIYRNKDGELYSDINGNEEYREAQKVLENIIVPENTVFEKIEIPKLNPLYNSRENYIPRSERPEWTTVGLLGKLRIRTAERITSKFIDIDSSGQAINGTKYSVLKLVKEFDGNYGIVLVFFK